MKCKTILKKIRNLTPKQYQDCYKLNHGSSGLMRANLAEARRRKKGIAVLAYDRRGQLASWALLARQSYEYTSPIYYDRHSGTQKIPVMFYTRGSKRRQGYGKKVAQRIAKYLTQMQTKAYVYTSCAPNFFRKAWNPTYKYKNIRRKSKLKIV